MFKPLIGKTIEVCIDDITAKSITPKAYIDDLHATFDILHKFKMCFNLEKYTFAFPQGNSLALW